jgi:hypothetical protein
MYHARLCNKQALQGSSLSEAKLGLSLGLGILASGTNLNIRIFCCPAARKIEAL